MHNSVKTVQYHTDSIPCNLVVGCFLLVLCVHQVSVSRLDWCRASSWVQGSAFCRFSMQGRCGCSQREGGHRPTPQHTDTVFCSRPHPITRPLLHKHTQLSTIILCPSFFSIWLICLFGMLPFPSQILLSSPLSNCLLIHLLQLFSSRGF